jgi:hypothetical protein
VRGKSAGTEIGIVKLPFARCRDLLQGIMYFELLEVPTKDRLTSWTAKIELFFWIPRRIEKKAYRWAAQGRERFGPIT